MIAQGVAGFRSKAVFLRACSILFFILTISSWAGTVSAQAKPDPRSSQAIGDLSRALIAQNARYQQASSSDKPAILRDMVTAATTRQQLLLAMIEQFPEEVIRLRIPVAVRAGMPAAVQNAVEADADVEGELEILHEDRNVGSRYLYFLKTTNTRFSLKFAKDAPKHLTTGARVRVRGVRVQTLLALGGDNTSVQSVAPAPASNALGERKVLMILVNFQDNSVQPYTVADAQSVLFGTTSQFFLENSYQQTWLSGDVAGWYTIPFTSTVCDIFSIASYAKSAASAAGYNLAAYTHYVYAFPQNACGGLGVGTVGGSPSEAWIIGSLNLKTLSHEIGHNLGLYHSHALDCGTAVLGTSCSVFEYGDGVDTMGNGEAGHFNAFQKERLDWLDYGLSPPITTVQANGLYTIEPIETGGTGPKALAILKSTDSTTGAQTWYYLEYRQALGFDSFLAGNSNVLNGILVHVASPSNGDSSYLLDMTPASALQNWSDWSDPALVVGQSYYDPQSGVTISPVSVSNTGAVVSVNFAAPACVHAIPSVTVSPAQTVLAGTAVTYTVSVTNRDPSSCSASSFALQVTPPSGWQGAFAISPLTLSPGVSSSTTLTVNSPPTASAGTYSIGVSASNSAAAMFTASTTAIYVIASALSVNAATDKAAYTRNQTATISAMVTAAGTPVANASVSFLITKSNGTTTTGSATTDAKGAAVFKLRFKRQDPPGQYQAKAKATATPTLIGEGSTSFAVQ